MTDKLQLALLSLLRWSKRIPQYLTLIFDYIRLQLAQSKFLQGVIVGMLVERLI